MTVDYVKRLVQEHRGMIFVFYDVLSLLFIIADAGKYERIITNF